MEMITATSVRPSSRPLLPLPGLKRRMLILGSGKLAVDLCQIVLDRQRWTTEIVGFLDKEPGRIGQRLGQPSIIGTYDQLFEIAESYNVHTIAVCLEDRRAVLPVQTLLDFKAMGIDVIDGHMLFEEEAGRLSIDVLRPSALIFSTGFRRRWITMTLKRLIDIVVSIAGLLTLAPLMFVVALLIKLDSPGPIFYRQMRVGLRGHPYMMWKFRSMSQDAEKHGPRWADANDPRISRVGRWLRKLRIDEFPQLINVLKGEMSLVGPRPERPIFVQELRSIIPYYDLRHTVRPGITGWAQTRFRYGASAEDAHTKLQYDLYYVKNLSLRLDALVLVQTVRVMLRGEGAR
ncbi:MAG: TIGR03013 family XrtA/PEP-CTERM system glycosyltransferase [Nitrospirota bacterium]